MDPCRTGGDTKIHPNELTYYEPEPNTGCWIWLRGTSEDGYGRWPTLIEGKRIPAHRVMYQRERGPIPPGLQLDHLCRVRSCVNPAHLEPVTCRENLYRGNTAAALKRSQMHCIRGHEFTPENTYRKANSGRGCLVCRRAASMAWKMARAS